jgi:RimJ/RimL family protein N-acetyltransferase
MPTLAGPSLTLRPPRASDGEDRFALGNDPGIMRMFGADPNAVPPLTLEAARGWIARLTAHPHAWVVEHEGRFLGELRLDDLDRPAHHARLAVGLYDAGKLGQGLGREAVRLALDHAFGSLGLERITLRVLAYNERAIRCYRACGFREVRREPAAVHLDGRWHDDVIMEAYSAALGAS